MRYLFEFPITSIYVLRPPYIERLRLTEECKKLASQTSYKYSSLIEEAPYHTHCVTALVYIFFRMQMAFPYVWIGDMPRTLVQRYHWKIIRVSFDNFKAGDLIFIQRNSSRELENKRHLIHVMIALSSKHLFHSSLERKGGYIEPLAEKAEDLKLSFLARAPTDASLLFRYIDPRNVALRTMEGGPLVHFPLFKTPSLRGDLYSLVIYQLLLNIKC